MVVLCNREFSFFQKKNKQKRNRAEWQRRKLSDWLIKPGQHETPGPGLNVVVRT